MFCPDHVLRSGRGGFTTVALTQIDPDDPKNKEIIERTRWDDPSNIDYIRELYKVRVLRGILRPSVELKLS